MISLVEWVFGNFKINFEPSSPLKLIYFKYKSIIPADVHEYNTDLSWIFLKSFILNLAQVHKVIEPEAFSSVILTPRHLLDLNDFEKLYYLVGKNFVIYLFLECLIYYKWGSSTYILISDFQNSLEPTKPNYSYYKPVPTEQRTGYAYGLPLNMYRMLYNVSIKSNKVRLLPYSTLDQLSSTIWNLSVGQEVCGQKAFTEKKIKVLKKVYSLNPTFKDCKQILKSIVDNKDVIPPHEVTNFVIKVMKTFVPDTIFGHKKFFNKYLRNIKQLLVFNSKQTVTLGFLVKGIANKGDQWEKNVAAKIALWLFQLFVIRLLRNIFYISEIDKGYSLVFIKKDFWVKYQNEALKEMITSNKLVNVDSPGDTSGANQLRFVPKMSGLGYRPLIRKSANLNTKKIEDLEMCNIFLKQLIATKYGKYPRPMNDLHYAWSNFSKLKQSGKPCYYVKTDIMDAYGSIKHDKLKSILKSLCEGLPEQLNLVSFKYKGKWRSYESALQFLTLAPTLGSKTITYETGSDKAVQLSEIKSIIFDYIDNILISQPHKKSYYRLICGLHQGGKLSAALCELYYSAFDVDYLSEFKSSGSDILLRAVDDYVLLSQSKEKILGFLELMLKGIPEYGMTVQVEKTKTNLQNNCIDVFTNSCKVAFFGYILDVKTCYISPNMEKYENNNIRSSIVFKKLLKSTLENKMSYTISLKLQRLLLDPLYQSKRILFTNIHISSCLLALKCVGIVHFLRIAEIVLEEPYLKDCIMKGINAISYSSMKKGKPDIQFDIAKKIALRAFLLVLRKKSCFVNLVKFLSIKEQHIKICSKKTVKMIKSISKTVHPSLETSLKHI